MEAMDTIKLQVTTLLVEMVELHGPDRRERREQLEKLRGQCNIASRLIELIRGEELGYAHRMAAAHLLAEWQVEQLLPVLEDLINTGIEPLQEIALSTLYRFGDPLGIDGLIALLDHPDPMFAGRVCDYLGESRATKAVAPLARTIHQMEPVVSPRAVNALAQHDSDESRAALEACSRHPLNAELKERIRQALNPSDP